MLAPVARLMDAMVRSLRPQGRRYQIGDSEIRGLSIRIGKGGRKTWIFTARFGRHPSRRSLGQFPEMGLADARAEGRRWRVLMHEGKDPTVERARAQRRKDPTFSTVAEAYFSDMKRRGLRQARREEQACAVSSRVGGAVPLLTLTGATCSR